MVGGGAELGAGGFAVGGGLGHVGKGVPVFADGLQLLVEQGEVSRLLNHRQCAFEAAVERVQQVSHGSGALFATAHFIVHAGDTQVFGQLVEAGDVTQLIAAADDAAHARPAVDRDQQGQQQNQAKANAQLAIDAHVSKILG
ncbi:hypothetical protein D3C78_1055140 [compost metagenome]